MKYQIGITLSIVFGSLSTIGHAETLPTRPVLTLEAANRVLSAAISAATQHDWPGVVAVVDSEGILITMVRMDNAPMLASVEIAPQKAKSAALFAKPTQALEDTIHNGRWAAITSGFVQMAGGMPLVINGQEVGAIGVSTAKPSWDVQIAAAGAAALTK